MYRRATSPALRHQACQGGGTVTLNVKIEVFATIYAVPKSSRNSAFTAADRLDELRPDELWRKNLPMRRGKIGVYTGNILKRQAHRPSTDLPPTCHRPSTDLPVVRLTSPESKNHH
jgi:hypothetical protein